MMGMEMDDGMRRHRTGWWKLFGLSVLVAVVSLIVGGWLLGSWFVECPKDTDDLVGAFHKEHKKVVDVRLPRDVVPKHYNVKLVPFIWPGNFTFHGEVRIRVEVVKETNKIQIHAVDLDIWQNATRLERITDNNRTELVKISRQYNDTGKQLHVVETDRELSSGDYWVYLKFVGILNDYLQGFYRSSYTVGSETRWIAATQFQPTDARRAFPCFDEPELKAQFEISIAHPSNMTAISNMPVQRSEPQVAGLPSYVWDHFDVSSAMSTYLVAFIVSDFDLRSDRNGHVRVWARKGAIDQTAYALEIAPRILKHYEDFFQIPFPLPKIDMVALPDFSAGAMENWGLITYRETAMLYQDGTSTAINKQRVATVVAHELAHQWFGNLVTPSWWSDLWLNEGFASYVENIGVNAVEPSWKALEQFVVHELQSVFGLDALESSHPISVEVGNPDEINEIFDRISYSKGAAVIRMMDHFLTTKVFRAGLADYLNRYSFKSAQQDDLWRVLNKHAKDSGVLQTSVGTVKDIMDRWTLQTGFPVITVTRDYENNQFAIVQERFTLANKSNDNDSKSPLWYIPITYTYPSALNFTNTFTQKWMTKERMSMPCNSTPDEWVIFNVMQTGYYRVNYDKTNWERIIKQLHGPNHELISTINRAQLIDDALNLARAGRLDYATALDVISYMDKETEYLPWKSALVGMSFLDSMLVKFQGYDLFREYALQLLDRVYKKVGFTDNPNDPQLTVFTRIDILTWACMYGHQDCVNNAKSQFNRWRDSEDPNGVNPISPNLKGVVYCTAVRTGGEMEWNFVWKRYLESNVGSEKDLLLYALGCTRETWLLSRYLDWAVTNKSGIRKQDVTRVFGSVSSNIIGQPLAFNYIRERWTRMKSYFGTSILTINNVVKVSTRRINTKYELKDLREFEKEHRGELGSATRAVEQAVEQGLNNIKWLEQNHESILKWLQKNELKASKKLT